MRKSVFFTEVHERFEHIDGCFVVLLNYQFLRMFVSLSSECSPLLQCLLNCFIRYLLPLFCLEVIQLDDLRRIPSGNAKGGNIRSYYRVCANYSVFSYANPLANTHILTEPHIIVYIDRPDYEGLP